MNGFLEIIGKFHPLLLHVPIGVLIYCYLHIIYDFWKKNEDRDLKFALFIGAISAIASAVSGYLLADGGEYVGDTLSWHKYLGIATAVLAILLFLSYNKISTKLHFLLFSFFMIILGFTGHYGGSMTHGSDFLSVTKKQESTMVLTQDELKKSNVYADLIMPIIDKKCVSCHNPSKTKGELLLHDLEGWKMGGKNGSIIMPGNLIESTLNKRIHLEKTEKHHMPPEGKPQLTYEEIKLMDWWVSKMSNYEHILSELNPSEEIMLVLDKLYSQVSTKVKKASDSDIQTLSKKGFRIIEQKDGLPWLSVSSTQKNKLGLSSLKKIKEQIVELDLSECDLTDSDLDIIKKLENLRSLNLSKTKISSKGIKKIKKLSKLTSLNLFGTKVDKEMLSSLESMKNLNQIYLWNTTINQADIDSWSNKPEQLIINLGADQSIFGKVQLKAPLIEAENDIFTDSLQVSFITSASRASIYYSLDGSPPDTNSLVYENPFYIYGSSEIRTLISMKGWENSEIATRTFVRSKYRPLRCNISPKPADKYKGDGGSTLIDLKKGGEEFANGAWLGFQKTHINCTIDLGEEENIHAISMSSLEDYASYIFFPNQISISISNDGNDYRKVAEKRIEESDRPSPKSLQNFLVEFPEEQARFIKLDIKSRLINPDWHPVPGAPCWVFIDEILVE